MSRPLKNHDRSRDFLSLARSSGALVVAQVGGVASGFVLMLLLARTIDQDDLGRITTGFSLAMLLAVITTVNLESGNFRFLSRYLKGQHDRQAVGYIRSGLRLVLGIGSLVWLFAVLAWSISKYLNINIPGHILLAILAAPIFGWLRINSSYMHANGKVLLALIPRSLLRPLILLITVAVATAAGFQLDSNSVMYLFIVTLLLVALLQNQLNRRTMRSLSGIENADFSAFRQWIGVGLQTLIPIFFIEYSTDIIVVLSSLVLAEEDLAVLGIVLRIVGLLSFGVAAVNMAFGPRLAIALGSEEQHEANRLLMLGGHLKLWPALLGYLVLVSQAELILGIFGPGYKSGELSLAIIATMPLVLAFFGPTTFSMTVLGLQKWGIPIFFVSLIGLMALIYILGNAYGINGVAVAVVLVWLFWNAALYGLVRVKRGYDLSLIGVMVRMIRRRAVEV